MSKIVLIFGLLVVAAIVTAGCTGTKTIENKQNPGQMAAMDDYKKYAKELGDEISFLENHYPLSPNVTVDQYRAWLDGFGEKLALCRQMYNNTTAASNKYLGYLNNTSSEYRNVTAADTAYAEDIEQLNRTYWNHSEYLDTFTKKTAALEAYKAKLSSSMDAYGALTGLAKNVKIDSLEAYANFLGQFKGKANAYEARADDALEAGEAYGDYCEPGSEEYKTLRDNNNALKESVRKCWDTYNNYKTDYESKAGAKAAINTTFNDYISKVQKANALEGDLQTYRNDAEWMKKLDKSWLDGYKQKVDAFGAACNDAIAAGNACKQYLDPSGGDYKSVTDNENRMKGAMTSYSDNYDQIYKTYRNLHPLGSIIQ